LRRRLRHRDRHATERLSEPDGPPEGSTLMKRFVLPLVGVLAALWATLSIARTQPRRENTAPPAPPPVSDSPSTVAAVGLVEASTENISVGSPLPAVVERVFVTPGQMV